jgi:hypothetical protein
MNSLSFLMRVLYTILTIHSFSVDHDDDNDHVNGVRLRL